MRISICNNLSIFQQDDPIEFRKKVQSVQGYYQGSFRPDSNDTLQNFLFCWQIHAGSGFIHQDERTVACCKKSACQSKTLFLSNGEIQTLFTNVGIQTIGKPVQYTVKSRK